MVMVVVVVVSSHRLLRQRMILTLDLRCRRREEIDVQSVVYSIRTSTTTSGVRSQARRHVAGIGRVGVRRRDVG